MDLYLLTVHTGYEDRRYPHPITGTVVPADALRHPDVPQPDGMWIYLALTDPRAGCRDGEVVPMSNIIAAYASREGKLPDWAAVGTAVAGLVRRDACHGDQLGLDDQGVALFAAAPGSVGPGPDGKLAYGPDMRDAMLASIEKTIRGTVADGGPYWPGDGLIDPEVVRSA